MAAKKGKEMDPSQLFVGFSEALSAIGEEKGLANVILGLAKDRFGGDHGMLLEPEETTGNLREIAAFGEIEEMLSQDMRQFAQFGMDHPDDEESVVIAPVAKDLKKLDAKKSIRRDMSAQVLIFPLPSAEGEAMGVIYLGSKVAGQMDLKDLDAAKLVAYGKTLGEVIDLDRTIRRLRLQNQALQKSVTGEVTYENLVGNSEAIQRIKRALDLVVPTDYPVVLIGEKGTGKKLIANILHNNSARKKKPFIRFALNEIPEQMIMPLLFGQTSARAAVSKTKKGALREAKGGTLFIEDVEKLPLMAQSLLMQALEKNEAIPVDGETEYPVDIRLIVSTTANLKEEFDAKRIRQDFYLHLNIFPILIPPLRDRIDDLPLLVAHFIELSAASFGKEISGVSSEVYDYLGTWEWPGNLAELEQEIRKAVLRTPDRGGTLTVGALSKHLISQREPEISLPREGTLKQRIAGIEKRLIMEALEQYKHNQSITADKLGLSRQALINKLHRYGIETGRQYKRRLKEITAQAAAQADKD